MKRATVSETVTFEGPSPDARLFRLFKKQWITNPTRMRISQPSNEGLYWKIDETGKEHPIDIFHTYAKKGLITGARKIAFCEERDHGLENKFPEKGEKAFVMEHIAATLHYVGITDATIELEPALFEKTIAYAPIIDAGIRTLVEKVNEVKFEWGEEVTPITINAPKSVDIKTKRFNSHIYVQPDDQLSFYIKRSDLGKIKLQGEPITIENVNKNLDLDARPVARINNSFKAKGLQWLNNRGYKGVSPETYIIGKNGASEEDLIKQMRSQFQQGKNEQLWHSAIDRYGESYTIAGIPIQGRFVFDSVNHLTVMEAFKKLYKADVFNIPNQ